jgi:fibronectin type 3 domain-containing protein
MNSASSLQFYLTTGIVVGNKYRFMVLAQNSIGYSAPSNFIEMMPATTPSSVTNLVATSVTSSSISISWSFDNTQNGGTPITDYQVYWDRGQNG